MAGAPCATAGCVALASEEGLCTIHAGLKSGRIVPVEPPREEELTLEWVDAGLKKRHPRLRRFITAIQTADIPVPVLMTYAFHSPFATILVAPDSDTAVQLGIEHPQPGLVRAINVYHVVHHLTRQVRRFRRRHRVGVVERPSTSAAMRIAISHGRRSTPAGLKARTSLNSAKTNWPR